MPTIIDKIVWPDGHVRYFGNSQGTRVFPYAQTYAADQVLKQVLTAPGATGAGLSWGCPAAGKTGTAENLANAWFVGYTPQISTGVWVGYPQGNIPINDGFGGFYAGPIWKDYMESAADGYCGDWTAPPVPFAGTAFTGPHSVERSGDQLDRHDDNRADDRRDDDDARDDDAAHDDAGDNRTGRADPHHRRWRRRPARRRGRRRRPDRRRRRLIARTAGRQGRRRARASPW